MRLLYGNKEGCQIAVPDDILYFLFEDKINDEETVDQYFGKGQPSVTITVATGIKKWQIFDSNPVNCNNIGTRCSEICARFEYNYFIKVKRILNNFTPCLECAKDILYGRKPTTKKPEGIKSDVSQNNAFPTIYSLAHYRLDPSFEKYDQNKHNRDKDKKKKDTKRIQKIQNALTSTMKLYQYFDKRDKIESWNKNDIMTVLAKICLNDQNIPCDKYGDELPYHKELSMMKYYCKEVCHFFKSPLGSTLIKDRANVLKRILDILFENRNNMNKFNDITAEIKDALHVFHAEDFAPVELSDTIMENWCSDYNNWPLLSDIKDWFEPVKTYYEREEEEKRFRRLNEGQRIDSARRIEFSENTGTAVQSGGGGGANSNSNSRTKHQGGKSGGQPK